MQVVKGARCDHENMTARELEAHGSHAVLYCGPCMLFVYPCLGERHVCPKLDISKLAGGEWTEIAVGEEAVAALRARLEPVTVKVVNSPLLAAIRDEGFTPLDEECRGLMAEADGVHEWVEERLFPGLDLGSGGADPT